MTPNPANNPALKSVEQFPHVGFSVVVAPSSYDGIDGVDELVDGKWDSSVGSRANSIHELSNGLVLGVCIDVDLRLFLNLFPR
jgi:hypothetical protein